MALKAIQLTLFLALICTLVPTPAAAQQDTTLGWNLSGVTSLTIAQVAMENWQAGGQSSMALNGFFHLDGDYRTERWSWNTAFEVGYGVLRQGELYDFWRKSNDRLTLLSKVGREISDHLLITTLADFRTQVDAGYDFALDSTGEVQRTLISDLMAPGYLTTSLGLEYKPREDFYLYLSPLTGKFTFVLVDEIREQALYGNEPDEAIRKEFGASLNAKYKKEIMKNITFQTNLSLFSNFADAEHVDVQWETLTVMKVNKWISANITTNLIYDNDVLLQREDGTSGPAVQWKEVLNVGLSYEFD